MRRGPQLRGERRADDDEAGGRRAPWALIAAWALFLLVLAGGALWLHLAGPLPRPVAPQAEMPALAGAETGADSATANSGTADAGATAEPGAVPPPPLPPGEPGPDLSASDGPPALPPAGDEPAAGGEPAAAAEPPPPARVDPAWLAATQSPLPPAPDPNLQDEGMDGILPHPGPGGEQPWQVYARPFEAEVQRPRIAIAMGGLGMDSPATVRAIDDLPGQVSLVLSPYAANLQDWVEQARGRGHEVLLALPVEPQGFPANDPGPHALLASLGPAERGARLRWTLAQGGGYVGLAVETASPVMEDAEIATPLAAELKKHGLMLLDAGGQQAPAGLQAARAAGLPYAAADLQLDADPAPAAIDRSLTELERLAREKGRAVGYALPYPVSIDRIAAWAQGLAEKGIDLAPVTAAIVPARPD